MEAKPTVMEGRAWVIADASGKLIADVDTDQIYHNAHLAVTDVSQMGQYAFGNLEGWTDFPAKAQAGDILVVGANFGAGSSRQQAVDCFRTLGVAAVVGVSFGAIYKRNAINAGWPLVECRDVTALKLASGDRLRLDFGSAELSNAGRGITARGQPWSRVQREIYEAGDIFAYGASVR